MLYIGRFAPSPTGELHFGSLVAAVASFLDARANKGKWLLRIEDIDPPREQIGIKYHFPVVLKTFGLNWDDSPYFQSERLDGYCQALNYLQDKGYAYRCSCSRRQIKARNCLDGYDRYCLQQPPVIKSQCAMRVKCQPQILSFKDRIQGLCEFSLQTKDDFIIYRRDKLFAYQLAVVADDYLQGVTHVVRGSDLLNETPRQMYLQQLLGYPVPCYAHIPMAVNSQGLKLSKQNLAPPLDINKPEELLFNALKFLGQSPKPKWRDLDCESMIRLAVQCWDINKVPAAVCLGG